jgi:hypothetical protein
MIESNPEEWRFDVRTTLLFSWPVNIHLPA